MLTISQRGLDPVVSVSFHSGQASESDSAQPSAECFVYPDRAPILAIDQGALHAHVSVSTPECVSAQDLDFARELAHACLRYFEALQRWHTPTEPGARDEQPSPESPEAPMAYQGTPDKPGLLD